MFFLKKKKSNYPIKNVFLIFFEDNIKSGNKAARIKLYPQFILKVTQDCVRR